MAGGTIFLGGIVEGYHYGLSLGTKWPYTRDIHRVALSGDPEAIHRIFATLVGIFALVIVAMDFNTFTLTGLVFLGITALLGMSTLYVLAGKLPSIFQGLHDIAAYTTFLIYFLLAVSAKVQVVSFFTNPVLLAFYLVIFLGGSTTGLRRMEKPVGFFKVPKTRIQLAWTLHGVSIFGLLFLALISGYSLTVIAVLADAALGGVLYMFINRNPSKPGLVVGLHQIIAIITVLTIGLYSIQFL